MALKSLQILGYQVLNESAEVIAAHGCEVLGGSPPTSYVFLNPHSVVVANIDPMFSQAIMDATAICCDGAGMVFAGLILCRTRIRRVYGFEFFLAMSRQMSTRECPRVFFLGGRDAFMTNLLCKYREEYPSISAVEYYSPPFRDEFSPNEVADMAARISKFRPDFLWIGLGSPKQEKVLHQLMPICGAHAGAAIGAVFDFYAGAIPHAPLWVRHLGFQWAHRLVLEPRRLWKRTFVSAPLFLWLVLRELFGLRGETRAD